MRFIRTRKQHLNQMKLSAFVAIAAVIGGSFLIPVPADASAWVDLKNNKQLLTNDGDPTVSVDLKNDCRLSFCQKRTHQ